MGISLSGDLFNQTTDAIMQGMSNMIKEVDDVLLFSDTIEGVADNLEEMLTRFGEEVRFAGMRITKDGCAADPDRIEAVGPRPETRSQV